MEKRLCYCKSCRKFFIIDPDKKCPNCGYILVSSVVTESEWNRSSSEQRNAYKSSMSSMAHTSNPKYEKQASSSGSSGSKTYSNPFSEWKSKDSGAGYSTHSYSPDYEKKLKSYKTWSIVIAVIGIISLLSLFGQAAEIEAQGYVVTNKTPLYLGYALSIFCAFAGFYGMGVFKQPSKLNTSWILYIVVLIGMAVLAGAFQIMPGWLCAVGCAINIYNGSKLKKMV